MMLLIDMMLFHDNFHVLFLSGMEFENSWHMHLSSLFGEYLKVCYCTIIPMILTQVT